MSPPRPARAGVPPDATLEAGEDWDDWSPVGCYGSALAALWCTGAPLTAGDEVVTEEGGRLTRRWCRAAIVAFPAEGWDRPLARRFLARLVADEELLRAWLAVLHVGAWDACCRFAEAHAAEP